MTWQELVKLEKNYYQTLDNLRRFEETLKPEEKELFLKNFKELDPDQTYSLNRNLPLDNTQQPVETQNEDEPVEDPHLLMSQKNESFSQDTEESVGTIEDYKKIKGL